MKEQIIEEAATTLLWKKYPYHPPKDYGYWKDMFKEGAKWNEEIMIDFANWCRIHDKKFPNEVWTIQQLHTKYFNETYGSKGSETTPSKTTSEKWKEYQDWLNEITELSDEQIEKEGWKYCYENKISSTNIVHWITACKWYREQLKQKI